MKPKCPACKRSNRVRRSHRVAGEGLLSLVFLFPFRCDGCDSRFYRFANREKPSRKIITHG
jgi:transposase-like protein